jgi:hypothetical protein
MISIRKSGTIFGKIISPTMSSLIWNSPSRYNSNLTNKRKTTQLKEMINSTNLEFIMEAHSGLSARIVEESGK